MNLKRIIIFFSIVPVVGFSQEKTSADSSAAQLDKVVVRAKFKGTAEEDK